MQVRSISIHAPREGGDDGQSCGFLATRINHAPREGATYAAYLAKKDMKFPIHPPARGPPPLQLVQPSFIHAPREGATWRNKDTEQYEIFQSTPPRGGRRI